MQTKLVNTDVNYVEIAPMSTFIDLNTNVIKGCVCNIF